MQRRRMWYWKANGSDVRRRNPQRIRQAAPCSADVVRAAQHQRGPFSHREHARRRLRRRFVTGVSVRRPRERRVPEVADAVLDAKGLLREGVRGLGFAVGREPLAALFASRGCRVTATDLASQDPRARAWRDTGQHAVHLAVLNSAGICPEPLFRELVSFRSVDMNDIPSDLLRAEYDFTWSTCSFEHCGTLNQGLAFVRHQMDCLRPGGIAVHTTELNLSSNTTTIASGPTVIYRRRDIERLVAALAADGHAVAPLELDLGEQPLDRHVDHLPYDFDRHMRLALYGYVVTSIGLVVTKRA